MTAVTLMMASLAVCASLWVLPYIDQYKSPRPLSLAINGNIPSNAPLYIYADTMNDFNFYTGRERIPVISPQKDGVELMIQTQPSFLLIRDRDLQRLNPFPKDKVLVNQSVGGKTWYLVSLADVGLRR